MNAVQQKYIRLLRLARDQEGKPEGETAAAIAARMQDKYGATLQNLTADDLEVKEQGIRWSHSWEREMIISIANWLGYTCSKKRDNPRGGAWRKIIYMKAPVAILTEWEETYNAHRGRLERIRKMAVGGYLLGAFPSSLPEVEGGDEGEGPDFTDEELEMLRKAMDLGRRNRTRKALPSAE